MTGEERERARKVVRMAAKQVETPMVKDWLVVDRLGSWEARACVALAETAKKAADLDLSEDEVDAQVATFLAMTAAIAVLKNAALGGAA